MIADTMVSGRNVRKAMILWKLSNLHKEGYGSNDVVHLHWALEESQNKTNRDCQGSGNGSAEGSCES